MTAKDKFIVYGGLASLYGYGIVSLFIGVHYKIF